MTFISTPYFRCTRPGYGQNCYRPGLCNPVHYRCPYCGGELMIDRHPNLVQPEMPVVVSRSSVIVQTVNKTILEGNWLLNNLIISEHSCYSWLHRDRLAERLESHLSKNQPDRR